MIRLYPHQRAALDATHSAIKHGLARGAWGIPTGGGKTIGFLSLATELGWTRTLVLVHRDELIQQTIATVPKLWPEASVGVIQRDLDEWRRNVVTASVQTLHKKRLERYDPDLFDLVIADEMHHYVGGENGNTWGAVLDHFKPRFLLGVSATPERADGKGLDHHFGERLLYSYPLRAAIEDGYLVRIRQYGIRTGTDLSGIKQVHGDFAKGELSEAVNTPARNKVIVEAYQEHCAGRRAIVFSVDVQHAKDLKEAFSAAGVGSEMVTGNTPTDERRQLLRDFFNNDFRVLTNCAVLTEGFDDPAVSSVLMARPTRSRTLYTQCVGRGLRLAPNKEDCVVLDFNDNSRKHKLITVMSLLGRPGASTLDDAGGGDVLGAIDKEVAYLEEQAIIQGVKPLSWVAEAVSPWPEVPNLQGYEEQKGWHADKASEKQLKFIRAFGLDTGRDLTKGEASFLIDRCLDLRAKYPELATKKQLGWLNWKRRTPRWREMMPATIDGLSKREAMKLIGQIQAIESGRSQRSGRE